MSCPVCGSDQQPLVLEGVSDRVTKETFRLLRCARCGFARTDPVPPSLDRYYPERYRRYGGLSATVLRSFYRGRVRSWLRDLPAGGRALELGSGTGWMLEALSGAGWYAAGTERTADAARIAAASGADVRVGGLEAFANDPAFDLVVMFHVLEHLEDPMAALRAAHERLAPGGVLLLGLPNLASCQSRMTGRHWMHLDVHGTSRTSRQRPSARRSRRPASASSASASDPSNTIRSDGCRAGSMRSGSSRT